jgi:hypothetical protein
MSDIHRVRTAQNNPADDADGVGQRQEAGNGVGDLAS